MKKKEIIMAKKYDYQLKIITPSEAMEIKYIHVVYLLNDLLKI